MREPISKHSIQKMALFSYICAFFAIATFEFHTMTNEKLCMMLLTCSLYSWCYVLFAWWYCICNKRHRSTHRLKARDKLVDWSNHESRVTFQIRRRLNEIECMYTFYFFLIRFTLGLFRDLVSFSVSNSPNDACCVLICSTFECYLLILWNWSKSRCRFISGYDTVKYTDR